MALTRVSGNLIGQNTVTNQNIAASVQDAYGWRNRIINGDMRIAQRGTEAVTTSPSFPVDRFRLGFSMDGACSMQQVTDAASGFINSIRFTTTTADTNLGTSQSVLLQHRIEGTNVADLGWGTVNAQTVTLSFWTKSSLTGTFGGSVQNSASNRSYPFNYTINATDTWEQKTITIDGDTTGTWLTDTGLGIRLVFSLGAGSSLVGTAGTWSGSDLVSATGAVSVIGTLNATWQITGVQLEVGSVATAFERRDFGRELVMCQRYFYNQINYMGQSAPFDNEATGAIGQSSGSAIVFRSVRVHPVEMRATPTVTFLNIECWDGTQRSVTSINNNNSSKYNRSVDWNMNANMTALGRPAIEFVRPSGFIACSSEL